jgi:hypothetical protein
MITYVTCVGRKLRGLQKRWVGGSKGNMGFWRFLPALFSVAETVLVCVFKCYNMIYIYGFTMIISQGRKKKIIQHSIRLERQLQSAAAEAAASAVPSTASMSWVKLMT